jgi:hypothetical protein
LRYIEEQSKQDMGKVRVRELGRVREQGKLKKFGKD